MGHYRSEMGFEEEDRKVAEAERKRLDALTALIAEDIEAKGIARVLAEIMQHNQHRHYGGIAYPGAYRTKIS